MSVLMKGFVWLVMELLWIIVMLGIIAVCVIIKHRDKVSPFPFKKDRI